MATRDRALPPWAEELRRRYLRGEAWQFVLHGNVHDLVLYDGRLLPVPEFLCDVLLAPTRELVLRYDVSSGVRVAKGRAGAPELEPVLASRAPERVLPALERLLLSQDKVGLVVEYAEAVAPAGDVSFASEADRAAVVALHRWSMSPALEAADNLVLLVAETLSDLHPRLVSNPRTATVRVPMPDEAARRAVVELSAPGLDPGFAQRLAEVTAGLKLVQVKGLIDPPAPATATEQERGGVEAGEGESSVRALVDAAAREEALALVLRRKREIIERECAGLVEFVEPRHDFSHVGGIEPVKAELRAIAENLRAGRRARSPMGLLFTGPMGTGKTFVAEAFAREAGLPALKLKNFRSKWVGATEGNLERILSVVQAMGPVIVMIDEGDRTLGGEGGESDGGTSSRVMARLKEFMADGANRGRVLFVVMTNRPDKLDVDLKRAGRLDRKIPFFPPQEPEEVEPVLLALLRRHGLAHGLEFPRDREAASAPLAGYSNAEIEQVVLLAGEQAGDAPVGAGQLAAARADFLPSRDREMLEYMELVAVFEASSRRLLPRKWAEMPAEELEARFLALRARVGGRR